MNEKWEMTLTNTKLEWNTNFESGQCCRIIVIKNKRQCTNLLD